MGIGAVGNDMGYYGNASTQKNSNSTHGAEHISSVGTATKETTSSNNGKTIGIMTVGSTGYLAKYADSSTPADPVIKVGEYEVKINEVDPNNATQLEMFAWTSYMEDIGEIEKSGMSSYSKMKAYAVQSQYNGMCSGIYDGTGNESDFWNKKQDWGAILSNAKNTFANMSGTYAQSLECGKLLSYFEKWSIHISENARTSTNAIDNSINDWERNLACKEVEESTKDDPIYEVTTTVNGETYTEKIHVNDVQPTRAIQQEMYAFFKHYDSINGTENSYEKFMAYMDTAKLHGYWDGNDSYDEFVNDTYNWREILPKVIGDASALGLQEVVAEGWALQDPIEKAFISKLDFDSMKGNIKSVEGKLTYTLPNIPDDMHNVLFSSFMSDKFTDKYGTQNLAILQDRIERRIAEQIDADGTRDSVDGMWDSAISVLESMCDELDSFFGEKLGDMKSVKSEIAGLKQMYQSVIHDLQNAKGETTEEVTEEKHNTDYFRDLLIEHIAKMYEKLKNGDVNQEFSVGSLSLTLDEWDKLFEKFDDIAEDVREAIKEEIEKLKEKDEAKALAKTDDSMDGAELISSEIRKTVFKEATDTEPELSYITCFTPEGIICKKAGMGENEYLWKIDYDDEQDYERVMSLLNSFPSDWDLRFTSNEKFWKDYLAERIDKDDFISKMNQFSDKGKVNYLIEKDGNTYINEEIARYGNYMNSPEDRIYNLQEFTELIVNELREKKEI